MDLGQYAQVAIIVLAFVITPVVILIAVLMVLLFFKLRPILDSMKGTSENLNEITSTVNNEVVKPAASFMAMIRGVVQGVEVFSRLFKKDEKEGG